MDKKQIPIVVAIVVVLIGGLAWWGMKNLGPEGKINTEVSAKQDDFIKEMKTKSGGDFSKLSAEEQDKLNKMSGGRGAMMLQHM